MREISIVNNSTDLILFWTLLAIIIYSIETYRLRDETYKLTILQNKQIQLFIVDLNQRILMHNDEARSRGGGDLNIGGRRIAKIVHKIYKFGELDDKGFYAPGVINDVE